MVPALKHDYYNQSVYPGARTSRPRGTTRSSAAPAPYAPGMSTAAPAGGAAPTSVRRPAVSPYVVLPLVGLLLLGAGMAFVAQRVQVMAMGYELVEAKAELARLQQEHTRLAAAVAKSRSLERVEYLARTRLGMVDAEPTAAVVIAAPTPLPAGEVVTEVALSDSPSPLAALGDWLHARFNNTAEAGSRSGGR